MSAAKELAGNVLGAAGWVRGRVTFGTHVETVEGAPVEPAGNEDPYVIPGFVDLHVHGGGGVDLMEGGDAARTIARVHARFGTTALLATTMTAPPEEVEAALKAVAAVTASRPSGGARVLGVHLEGPYISAERLGAQPDCARTAALEELDRYCALAPIRLVTLAPEVDGHLAVIRALSSRGVRVQVGHSAGAYADGVAALASGASGFTHLFNAMTGLHHRAPGIVGAALAHATYAELIVDLEHVHPGAIHVALRAIPRLYGVTDATAAAGMPDGEYRLGSRTVVKCANGVRLADGTIAGSALTMDQALRNLVSLGIPLAEASLRLSTYPADHLGLTDRGRIETHAWADLVVLDRALNVIAVVVEGERIWPR
jgi:N-acetylglucosamine-6-phosphate deacetylase